MQLLVAGVLCALASTAASAQPRTSAHVNSRGRFMVFTVAEAALGRERSDDRVAERALLLEAPRCCEAMLGFEERNSLRARTSCGSTSMW